MLANIHLGQNGLIPVKWQKDAPAKENPRREEYIQTLKVADDGDHNT